MTSCGTSIKNKYDRTECFRYACAIFRQIWGFNSETSDSLYDKWRVQVTNWARFSSFAKKNKYRTTSEYNFVIEQSLPVEPVQDLGFLEPGM